MRTKVYALLGRTGMCNRLFTWSHAYVFSIKNNLPLYVNGWYKTQIGPWIRKERTKRFYAFYFKNQMDLVGYVFRKALSRNKICYNPSIDQVIDFQLNPTIIYNSIPHFSKYFEELKGHNVLLSRGLMEMLKPSIQRRIACLKSPEIGVHVRRGDFGNSDLLEQLHFYRDAILKIRDKYGQNLQASIFSDGYEHELKLLLALPRVSIFRAETDIEDLIALSQSKFIVTSLGSTFSYWAAFLSGATIIHSPRFSGQPVRWGTVNEEDGFWIERPGEVFAESRIY